MSKNYRANKNRNSLCVFVCVSDLIFLMLTHLLMLRNTKCVSVSVWLMIISPINATVLVMWSSSSSSSSFFCFYYPCSFIFLSPPNIKDDEDFLYTAEPEWNTHTHTGPGTLLFQKINEKQLTLKWGKGTVTLINKHFLICAVLPPFQRDINRPIWRILLYMYLCYTLTLNCVMFIRCSQF